MYNVIDTCYGQNLGFEHTPTTVHVVSQVLEGERQLEEWQVQLLPSLGLQVFHKPLLPEDIEKISPDDVILQRFNIVLSLRYHNLRILLHRKFLEKFLDAYGANDSANQEKKILQQVGISSVQNCVESAVMIISTVHTIASSTGWRREILGAWNYSLYYSTYHIRVLHVLSSPVANTEKQLSTQALLYSERSLSLQRRVSTTLLNGAWLSALVLIWTWQLKPCDTLTPETA